MFNPFRLAARARIPVENVTEGLRPHVDLRPAEAIVVPAVGEAYIEEAVVAMQFAAQFCPSAKDFAIVSDLPVEAFRGLPDRARVVTLDVEGDLPAQHKYRQIFKSRLIKLKAPVYGRGEFILMTDSDLVLLKQPVFPWMADAVAGTFRTGRMRTQLRVGNRYRRLPLLLRSVRVHLGFHMNGAFVGATAASWAKLSEAWYREYLELWRHMPDTFFPSDQIALCLALDRLGFSGIDLGLWVNWPVSKQIGGRPARIPPEVIGAHGGLPVSEWEKYLRDPEASLCFLDQSVTRRVRYLSDEERSQAEGPAGVA